MAKSSRQFLRIALKSTLGNFFLVIISVIKGIRRSIGTKVSETIFVERASPSVTAEKNRYFDFFVSVDLAQK